MEKTINKILGFLIVVFLLGVLAKMMYWTFAPKVASYASIGISLILLIKTFISSAASSTKRAMYLVLGLSFLLSALSAFLGGFQNILLGIGGLLFVLFLLLFLIDHLKNNGAKGYKKYTLLLIALALFGLSYLAKSAQFQFANYALMLSFMLAAIWAVATFITKKES